MRVDRSVGLALLVPFLFGAGWATSRGADELAEATLKNKGLTKSGHAFVIEAEAPVLAKMRELRTSLAAYTALVDRQAMAEQAGSEVAELEERRVQLQSDLDDLNQQINLQAGQQFNNFGRSGGVNFQQSALASQAINQRNQIKGYLAEIGLRQKEVKSQAPPDKERTALDESLKKREEELKTALADLRPLVDEVDRTYADLAADERVKKSLAEVKKTSRMKLGPSDAFLAGETLIRKAERTVLGKTTPVVSRKKKARPRR